MAQEKNKILFDKQLCGIVEKIRLMETMWCVIAKVHQKTDTTKSDVAHGFKIDKTVIFKGHGRPPISLLSLDVGDCFWVHVYQTTPDGPLHYNFVNSTIGKLISAEDI